MGVNVKKRPEKLHKDHADPILLHRLNDHRRNKALKKALTALTITGAEIFRVRGRVEWSGWSFSLSGRETQILQHICTL